jgi:hypothetical protein
MTIATSYENVTANSPDGAVMGKGTTEKIAFYGSTPIVQATVAATTTTTATTTALQADIDAIRTALQNLGLIG